jgi:CarD family transcriptional regulator
VSGKSTSFGKGDWVVHNFYGVGQISGVETKKLGDIKTKYYKVKTNSSTYFIPINNIDTDRVRAIASDYMLRKVKKIIIETPNKLPDDHNARKKEISERLNDCSLASTAELIRDLSARKKTHHLNDNEEKILDTLTNQMVLEWSISKGYEQEKALEQLEGALEKSLAKV